MRLCSARRPLQPRSRKRRRMVVVVVRLRLRPSPHKSLSSGAVDEKMQKAAMMAIENANMKREGRSYARGARSLLCC